MKFLLFLTIAAALIIACIKELPEKESILGFLRRLGMPALAALLSFLGGSALFLTPVAGIFLAALGWILAAELARYVSSYRSRQVQKQIKDFVTSSTSLYMADNTTPEVVRITSTYMSEPIASDLQNMLVERELKGTTFPVMFNRLAKRYQVPEMGAVAKIIEAGDITGGARAIARGLSRLGDAIRRRERILTERYRGILEPGIAAGLVLIILIGTAVLDATTFRAVFVTNGLAKMMLGLGVGIIAGLSLLILNLLKNKDVGV